jgi:hypothetical protein
MAMATLLAPVGGVSLRRHLGGAMVRYGVAAMWRLGWAPAADATPIMVMGVWGRRSLRHGRAGRRCERERLGLSAGGLQRRAGRARVACERQRHPYRGSSTGGHGGRWSLGEWEQRLTWEPHKSFSCRFRELCKPKTTTLNLNSQTNKQ